MPDLNKQLKQCFNKAEALFDKYPSKDIPTDYLLFSCGHLMPLAYETGLNKFLQTGLFWSSEHQCTAGTFSVRGNCILCGDMGESNPGYYENITTKYTNLETIYRYCDNFFRWTIYSLALFGYIRDVRNGQPFSEMETEDLVSVPGKLVIDILFDNAMQSPHIDKSVAQSLKTIAKENLILSLKNYGYCEGGYHEIRCEYGFMNFNDFFIYNGIKKEE